MMTKDAFDERCLGNAHVGVETRMEWNQNHLLWVSHHGMTQLFFMPIFQCPGMFHDHWSRVNQLPGADSLGIDVTFYPFPVLGTTVQMTLFLKRYPTVKSLKSTIVTKFVTNDNCLVYNYESQKVYKITVNEK